MQGHRIGYIRVSSFDQNPDRQLEQVNVSKIFTDKASDKDTLRPALADLLAFVREGDTVVVHSMDRLARNIDDLRRLVQDLTKRGVRIEFVKEHLTFTGEDSPMANLLLSVMGAFAEFERALIKERQHEGIALARQRGAYRGRKKALTEEQVAELLLGVDAGEPKAALAREYGISRETEVTMGRFEKYIYGWITLCALAGLLLGNLVPEFVQKINALSVSGVSIPIAILMFFLMYPPMAKVKLEELSHAVKNVSPTLTTLIANWIVAPPLMVLLAWLVLPNPDFRAGAILLGISPCTGMVLFWIAFARGNVTQGVVITAINAVSTLLLYAPLAAFYLGIGGVPVPFALVATSVVLFVGLPLFVGQGSKYLAIRHKGEQWFIERFLPPMNTIAIAALLGMLVLLFSSEGQVILEHPLTVALIAVPIFLHFVLILAGTYLAGWFLRYSYEDASMAALIGSSTQFEVAIGTAMVVFGLGSGAALATVVGPLIEVPVMVTATKLLKRTRSLFPANAA